MTEQQLKHTAERDLTPFVGRDEHYSPATKNAAISARGVDTPALAQMSVSERVQFRMAQHAQQRELALQFFQRSCENAASARVQMHRTGQANTPLNAADQIKQTAVQGTQGATTGIPFQQQIQQSFGKHDVSQVRSVVGGSAETANQRMGSEAFAIGNTLSFKRSPDLHTAAHEAAHVIQQRGGVQLKSGVGQVGDAYEVHADQVADLVVQGKSTESLLNQFAGGQRQRSEAVQHKPSKGKKPSSDKKDSVQKPFERARSEFFKEYRDKALKPGEKVSGITKEKLQSHVKSSVKSTRAYRVLKKEFRRFAKHIVGGNVLKQLESSAEFSVILLENKLIRTSSEKGKAIARIAADRISGARVKAVLTSYAMDRNRRVAFAALNALHGKQLAQVKADLKQELRNRDEKGAKEADKRIMGQASAAVGRACNKLGRLAESAAVAAQLSQILKRLDKIDETLRPKGVSTADVLLSLADIALPIAGALARTLKVAAKSPVISRKLGDVSDKVSIAKDSFGALKSTRKLKTQSQGGSRTPSKGVGDPLSAFRQTMTRRVAMLESRAEGSVQSTFQKASDRYRNAANGHLELAAEALRELLGGDMAKMTDAKQLNLVDEARAKALMVGKLQIALKRHAAMASLNSDVGVKSAWVNGRSADQLSISERLSQQFGLKRDGSDLTRPQTLFERIGLVPGNSVQHPNQQLFLGMQTYQPESHKQSVEKMLTQNRQLIRQRIEYHSELAQIELRLKQGAIEPKEAWEAKKKLFRSKNGRIHHTVTREQTLLGTQVRTVDPKLLAERMKLEK